MQYSTCGLACLLHSFFYLFSTFIRFLILCSSLPVVLFASYIASLTVQYSQALTYSFQYSTRGAACLLPTLLLCLLSTFHSLTYSLQCSIRCCACLLHRFFNYSTLSATHFYLSSTLPVVLLAYYIDSLSVQHSQPLTYSLQYSIRCCTCLLYRFFNHLSFFSFPRRSFQ